MKFIFVYIPVCSDRYLVYKKKVYGYRERVRSKRIEAFINTIALLSRTTLKAYNVLFSKHHPAVNHFGGSLQLTRKNKKDDTFAVRITAIGSDFIF